MARYFMGDTRLESLERMMMEVPKGRDAEKARRERLAREKQGKDRPKEVEDDLQSDTE